MRRELARGRHRTDSRCAHTGSRRRTPRRRQRTLCQSRRTLLPSSIASGLRPRPRVLTTLTPANSAATSRRVCPACLSWSPCALWRQVSCEPVVGATVDIWHTNTSGLYSGYGNQGEEGTAGETFLRGKQVTDADGVAEFETIYPGWYPTRAVHIHFMAYTDEGHLVTSQLYFPDAVSEAVYRTEPYAARGPHPVTSNDDGMFPGDTVDSLLIGQVTENGEGYTISLTVGVTHGSGQAGGEGGTMR